MTKVNILPSLFYAQFQLENHYIVLIIYELSNSALASFIIGRMNKVQAEQYFSEMEIYCNAINVFSVPFKHEKVLESDFKQFFFPQLFYKCPSQWLAFLSTALHSS